jgi:hypothetical protein
MAGAGLRGQTVAAYDDLVYALKETSENAGVGFVEWIDLPSAAFKPDQAQQNITLLDLKIHLVEWQAGTGHVSILIQVREAIDRTTQSLRKSTVLVNYFQIRDGSAKHLHSMHFDFEGEQANHPVFHAQLCTDRVVVPEESARKLAFEYQLDHSVPSCFHRARIPTSDMTFASVLLCIAADHLEAKFFKEFLQSVIDIQAKMPLPPCARTRGSIVGTADQLRSYNWFAHM